MARVYDTRVQPPTKSQLTPGPRYDVQGTYKRNPFTGKKVPNTGDKIDAPRPPNQKYQGKKWGQATPHESNTARRRSGTTWAWGLARNRQVAQRAQRTSTALKVKGKIG